LNSKHNLYNIPSQEDTSHLIRATSFNMESTPSDQTLDPLKLEKQQVNE
jgi:hypothetical protein